MSFLRNVLSDASFSLVRTVVSVARSFIIIYLITNLLGTASYGIWSTTFAFVGMMSVVGEMHLHGSLTRYGLLDKDNEQTYSDTICLALIFGLLVSILVLAVGLLFDISMLLEGETNSNLILIFVSLLILFNIIFKTNHHFFPAKNRVKFHELISVIKKIVEITLLYMIFTTYGTVIGGIIGMLIVAIFSNIILFLYIITNYTVPKPDFSNMKKYVSFGFPMMIQGLFSRFLNDADKYMIIYFISPNAVGLYAVAYGISTMFKRATGILNSTLYPRVSQKWEENNFNEVEDLYNTIFKYYTIFSIPSLVGLIILSEELLIIVSTPDIAQEAWILVPVISLGFLLRGYSNPLDFVMTASEETEKISYTYLIAVAVNVVLNIIFIPVYGVTGAAVATVFSNILILVFIYWYASNHVKLIIPYRTIIRSCIAAFIMGVILINLPSFEHIYNLVVYPLVGVCVFFVMYGSLLRLDWNTQYTKT